jgi:hypothetical protein
MTESQESERGSVATRPPDQLSHARHQLLALRDSAKDERRVYRRFSDVLSRRRR